MRDGRARIVRLGAAWLVVSLCGAAGMWAWSVIVRPERVSQLMYTISALAFAGIGILLGVVISRVFLHPNEFAKLVHAPPDEQ